MTCCERCASVTSWSYRVLADGDGLEFLEELGELRTGGLVMSVVSIRTRTT